MTTPEDGLTTSREPFRLSDWLAERDAALAGAAAALEQSRPDRLAPAEEQMRFLSEMAEITGRREEVNALMQELGQ